MNLSRSRILAVAGSLLALQMMGLPTNSIRRRFKH